MATTNVLGQLEQLVGTAGHEQAAWLAVLEAKSADELAVGLDFAIEKRLIDSYFAPHLRGEPVAEVADRYWVHPQTGLEMVWIPAGNYPVGFKPTAVTEPSEPPPYTISLPGFFLSRHPVTDLQYHAFLRERSYEPDAGKSLGEPFLNHWSGGEPRSTDDNLPVVWVSYYDAAAYCDAYRLCLPNEWEWEAAARGSDARPYPWGRAPLTFYSFSRGNFKSGKRAHTGEGRLAAVDAYAGIRTAFGCEQMVGNVSEWCERLTADEEVALLGASSEEPPDERMRPVRGACFKRFTPQRCTCAHRRVLSAGRRNDWVGFRPAMAPSRWWR